MNRDDAIAKHRGKLSAINSSLESLMTGREYGFFQLRDSFMGASQSGIPAISKDILSYPIDYGLINNQDCIFVNHFWRTRSDPDPEGVDPSAGSQGPRDHRVVVPVARLDLHATRPTERGRVFLFPQDAAMYPADMV